MWNWSVSCFLRNLCICLFIFFAISIVSFCSCLGGGWHADRKFVPLFRVFTWSWRILTGCCTLPTLHCAQNCCKIWTHLERKSNSQRSVDQFHVQTFVKAQTLNIFSIFCSKTLWKTTFTYIWKFRFCKQYCVAGKNCSEYFSKQLEISNHPYKQNITVTFVSENHVAVFTFRNT